MRTARNILAVIIGLVIGNVVNMGIILIGMGIVAPPLGVDPSNMESIKASLHLYEPQHFLFPFLAHAGGTFVGALVASFIAVSGRKITTSIIGGLFLIGGIAACFFIPAPAWFMAVDLLLAYIPMAFLGWKLSGRK